MTTGTPMICSACLRETPQDALFCPFCGAPIDRTGTTTQSLNTDPTPSTLELARPSFTTADQLTPPQAQPRTPIPFPPKDVTLLPPGTVLLERYRIVSLLGRGGMGEVYRADDLKLSQSVALKFLPAALAQNEEALTRLRAEVRTARQISHPNVSRVYDIVEGAERPFLSMEYIDGEDLASLLRRIGRLPPDKAVETARQLCAAAGAAHDAGVLHHDLKPANVMIDGRGRAHVTDFGVAEMCEELQHAGLVARAGTPAYMAPEQIARGEVSVRSDIYSLGLILYEIFTGQRAFEAAGRLAAERQSDQATPSSLSTPVPPRTLVPGVDPVSERAILKCLEPDPANRPGSAEELARMLPGGDPLAAALAAGQTPSPGMVAAAGGEGTLARGQAWMLLAGVVAGLALILVLSPWATELGLAPIVQPPDAQVARAQQIVKKLGYTAPPADTASWFERNTRYLAYRSGRLASPEAWRTLRDAEQSHQIFHYRQSPRPLAPWLSQVASPLKVVSTEDPPPLVSGMVNVTLDTRGPLLRFLAVPPQVVEAAGEAPAPDWSILFTEAGLNPRSFQPETPIWIPPVPFDVSMGWQGSYARDPGTIIHVMAAAFRGRVVYFEVAGPWSHPARDSEASQVAPFHLGAVIITVSFLLIIGTGCYLAMRNLRLERGDPQGATELAALIFVVQFAGSILGSSYVPEPWGAFNLLLYALGRSVLYASVSWLMYVAVEPYVRQRWPQLLLGWSRVLAGRFQDPRVGRELLIGSLAAVVLTIFTFALNILPAWVDLRGVLPFGSEVLSLGRLNRLLGLLCVGQTGAILMALCITLLLLLALLSGRRPWVALLIAWVVLGLVNVLLGMRLQGLWLSAFRGAGSTALLIFVFGRYGMLAGTAMLSVRIVLVLAPLTSDSSSWYFGQCLLALALCMGISLYGFRTSLGGKPAFGTGLLDDARGAATQR